MAFKLNAASLLDVILEKSESLRELKEEGSASQAVIHNIIDDLKMGYSEEHNVHYAKIIESILDRYLKGNATMDPSKLKEDINFFI